MRASRHGEGAIRTNHVAAAALGLLLGACAGSGDAAGASNAPPVADPGGDLGGATGVAVHLDGSASADPDGDPLTFAWSFDARPAGSAAILQGADTSAASFVPDVRGAYEVRLTVDDGAATASATVNVAVAQSCRNFAADGGIDATRECAEPGEFCVPDPPESDAGICGPGDSCGFADQTGCAGAETCHPVGIFGYDNTDATLCMAAGAGGQMAGCVKLSDCAPGFACVVTAPGPVTNCLQYCVPGGAPCPGGLACYDLALDLPAAVKPSFGVGACL